MSIVRIPTVLLLAATAVSLVFGAVFPGAEFSEGVAKIGDFAIPIMLAFIPIIAVFLTVLSCFLIHRTAIADERGGLTFVFVGTVGSMFGYWYGYGLADEFRLYEFRAGVQTFFYLMATLLLASALTRTKMDFLSRFDRIVTRMTSSAVVLMAGASALIGGVLSYLIFNGMPHMHDGFTYLVGGRILMMGQLSLDLPRHPELFDPFFRHGLDYMYVQYPPGWPAILGLFDKLSVAGLANPMLAAGLVWVTYLFVHDEAGDRVAKLTALVLLVSPWLYWNAVSQLSHLAAAFWLILFLWLFIRAMRRQSSWYGLLSGLVLGCAIITRPQDAASFALPCALYGLWHLARAPRTQLLPVFWATVGVLPGLVGYLVYNAVLTGHPLNSTYGTEITYQVARASPETIGDYLIWVHESWVGMSSQWFVGVVPVALPVAVGLWYGRTHINGRWLLIACSVVLVMFYGLFVMKSRTWFGPRWYGPLIPVIAFLCACGLAAALEKIREPGTTGLMARAYSSVIVAAVAVCWLVATPLALMEHRLRPPHGSDIKIARSLEQSGLTNAVVALEVAVGGKKENWQYKSFKNGLFTMQVPIEKNDVIFVSKQPDWKRKATAIWPDRELYEVSPVAGDFSFHRVGQSSP